MTSIEMNYVGFDILCFIEQQKTITYRVKCLKLLKGIHCCNFMKLRFKVHCELGILLISAASFQYLVR